MKNISINKHVFIPVHPFPPILSLFNGRAKYLNRRFQFDAERILTDISFFTLREAAKKNCRAIKRGGGGG